MMLSLRRQRKPEVRMLQLGCCFSSETRCRLPPDIHVAMAGAAQAKSSTWMGRGWTPMISVSAACRARAPRFSAAISAQFLLAALSLGGLPGAVINGLVRHTVAWRALLAL